MYQSSAEVHLIETKSENVIGYKSNSTSNHAVMQQEAGRRAS
jgi:aminoglycoside phosphotransferase